jgi:hypothetical protein
MLVKFSMWEVTDTCAGYVSEASGQPLEEIFTKQEEADETETEENKSEHIAKMKSTLAGGTIHASGSFNGLGISISSARLSGVPTDLSFKEFMRHSSVQGMTLTQAGVSVYLTARQRFDESATGWDDDYTVKFDLYGSPGNPALKITDLDNIPQKIKSGENFNLPPSAAWRNQVISAGKSALGQKRIATFPKLI